MNIFWCHCKAQRRNFGDELTSMLLDYLGVAHRWSAVERAELVGIGSVLQMIPDNYSGTIWSSGAICQADRRSIPRARFLALRGKLTRCQIANAGLDDIPLGDGGLLCHLFRRPTSKRYRLGVIPHYAQAKDPVMQAIRDRPHLRIIDVGEHPLSVIRAIAECEHIASSSLHGLIVADALGIPNTWIELEATQARLIGGDFKFRDYYSIYDMQAAIQPVRISRPRDLDALEEPPEYARPGLADRQRRLLDSLWNEVAPYSCLPRELATMPVTEREQLILGKFGDAAKDVSAGGLVGHSDTAFARSDACIPLQQARPGLQEHPPALAKFFAASLRLLSRLKQEQVVHGDIRGENIVVEDGKPILTHFGWRVGPESSGTGRRDAWPDPYDQDLYAMGLVLRDLCKRDQPYRAIAELLVHENLRLRLTDASAALSLLDTCDVSRATGEHPSDACCDQKLGTAVRHVVDAFIASQESLATTKQKLARTIGELHDLEVEVARRELAQQLPSQHRTVVVDDEKWRANLRLGSCGLPLLEKDGTYWGLPRDDEHAIAEFQRLCREGAQYLLICKPSFWWLTHYRDWYEYVQAVSVLAEKNDRYLLFRITCRDGIPGGNA